MTKLWAEYHEVHVNSFVQELVARLSSRVFLGEELCRNRQWLDININSTITHMTAAVILRLFPWFLRPILNEVLPICRKIRAEQYVLYLYPPLKESLCASPFLFLTA